MGTLELKWGPNGDPKTEKGPHGDRVPQMGTHLGAVKKLGMGQTHLALFDISISNIDCRYIDTFEKYRYRYGHF